MSTPNILDIITQKLNGFRNEVTAMEGKLASQRDTFTAQIASLQDRARALEMFKDDAISELQLKQAALDEANGRITLLYEQLEQLGVTP